MAPSGDPLVGDVDAQILFTGTETLSFQNPDIIFSVSGGDGNNINVDIGAPLTITPPGEPIITIAPGITITPAIVSSGGITITDQVGLYISGTSDSTSDMFTYTHSPYLEMKETDDGKQLILDQQAYDKCPVLWDFIFSNWRIPLGYSVFVGTRKILDNTRRVINDGRPRRSIHLLR